MSAVSRMETEPYFSGFPSSYCVVQIDKISQVMGNSAFVYSGNPFPMPFVKNNTSRSNRVRLAEFDIEIVFSGRDFPQIGQPIVATITVNMVNLIRPASVNDRPCNPMGLIVDLAECPATIAVVQIAKRLFASKCAVPGVTALLLLTLQIVEHLNVTLAPVQLAGIRIIAEKLAANFWRDIGTFSHDAVLSHWGQDGVRGATRSSSVLYAMNDNYIQEHYICRGRRA